MTLDLFCIKKVMQRSESYPIRYWLSTKVKNPLEKSIENDNEACDSDSPLTNYGTFSSAEISLIKNAGHPLRRHCGT
jgi:hypothetical protein